jgi:hypothetical protein
MARGMAVCPESMEDCEPNAILFSNLYCTSFSLSTEEKGQRANKFTKYGSYKKFGLAFHRPVQALCFQQ